MSLSSSSSSSSSSSEDEFDLSFWFIRSVAHRRKRIRRGRMGSVRGRAANRSDLRIESARNLDRDFFCRFIADTPAASESRFTQAFHIPRSTFNYLREAVLLTDPHFFSDTADALGVRSCSTDQKVSATLMLLVDGVASAKLWPYLKIGNSTAAMCRQRFCDAIVKNLKSQWLRNPTDQELEKTCKEYARLGFPGCVGCLDCAYWEWSMCPVGWRGNHVSGKRKPCLRMEAICDHYLRIWHLNFGIPGSKNDLQVLYASPLFNKMRLGQYPPPHPAVQVADMTLTWYYYLVDGIYPPWRIFNNTYANPRNKKQKAFGRQQEAVRKAVERLFGVMFKRFGILRQPSRLWQRAAMIAAVETCAIIHNIIVTGQKNAFTGTRRGRIELEDTDLSGYQIDFHKLDAPTDRFELVEWLHEHFVPLENENDHQKLKEALTENMWAHLGENADEVGSSGDEF